MTKCIQLFKYQFSLCYARKLRSSILIDTCRIRWKSRVIYSITVLLFIFVSVSFLNRSPVNVSHQQLRERQDTFYDYSEMGKQPRSAVQYLTLETNEDVDKENTAINYINPINDTIIKVLLPSSHITFGGITSLDYPIKSINDGTDTSTELLLNIHKRQAEPSQGLSQAPIGTGLVCPVKPTNLLGRQPVVLTACADEVNSLVLSAGVLAGGRWQPPQCQHRHNIAVIVPVRDREEQVWVFLSHMHPFLQRQQLRYTIVIVEQAGTELFNRAKLLNIGFVEAMKMETFDCVVFHDVDMLPEDDRNLYHCSDMPRHMIVASSNDKYRSNLTYMRKQYYGGACMMTPMHVRRVNGWSNRYWGWGGEDDDMWRRVAAHDLPVWRYPVAIGRYTMIPHGPPPGVNKDSYGDLNRFSPHHRRDGLNSLRYHVIDTTQHPHHTRVLAHVGGPTDDKTNDNNTKDKKNKQNKDNTKKTSKKIKSSPVL